LWRTVTSFAVTIRARRESAAPRELYYRACSVTNGLTVSPFCSVCTLCHSGWPSTRHTSRNQTLKFLKPGAVDDSSTISRRMTMAYWLKSQKAQSPKSPGAESFSEMMTGRVNSVMLPSSATVTDGTAEPPTTSLPARLKTRFCILSSCGTSDDVNTQTALLRHEGGIFEYIFVTFS